MSNVFTMSAALNAAELTSERFNSLCLQLPKQLEAQEGLISQWTFPGECLQGDGTGDATLQLKGYMELLRNKVSSKSAQKHAREYFRNPERVNHRTISVPTEDTEGIDIRPRSFQM